MKTQFEGTRLPVLPESPPEALEKASTTETVDGNPSKPITDSETAAAVDISPPDDSWLDSWDLTIHRCEICQAPFRSASRLTLHREQPQRCSIALPDNTYLALQNIPLVVIDADGDLEVHVGPNEDTITHRFLVASQVLRCQSPAFSTSFSSKKGYGFKAAAEIRRAQLLRPLEPAVIFLDDAPKILELAFKILHHRYQDLEDKCDYNTLIDLATMCEKYMLHISLAPVMRRWANKIWDDKVWEIDGEDDVWFQKMGPEATEDGWLLISWVLGMKDQFTTISRYLAFKYGVTSEKEFVAPDGSKFHPSIPQSLKEKLLEQREWLSTPIQRAFEEIQSRRMFKYISFEGSDNNPGKNSLDMDSPDDPDSSSESEDKLFSFGGMMKDKEVEEDDDAKLSSPVGLPRMKAVCKSSINVGHLCDWIQLGHLTETTSRFGLDKENYWNQPVADIMRVFQSFKELIPKDGKLGTVHDTRRRYASERLQRKLKRALEGASDYNATPESFLDYKPWDEARSCCWSYHMKFVCEAVKRLREGHIGLHLKDFKSRVEIWGRELC